MFGTDKPGIAKAMEDRNIDLNRGVSSELIEA
jgi:hypothetical protein